MLGRSYSTLSRERNKIRPTVMEPEARGEEFYDRVYDDSTMSTSAGNVEEVYDTGSPQQVSYC